ncbi:MAG: hypothetical protein QOD68_3472 [Actinomycetota bacterium]|jgi:hypothetical protein|nr:hypothetical protein [Actinomycetota bacterium]
MSSIVGPYAGVENDYRRERITESFDHHRKTKGHRLFHRRTPKAVTPAIDWYGE